MGRKYNWFCVAVAGMGSMLYGCDNVVIAGTFAQPGFLARFKPSPTLLGAIVAAFYGGTMLGIIVVFLFVDKLSRRRTLQAGAGLGLVGAIMQTASYQIQLFAVARVLAGIASGMMFTTVQVYQSEISPPEIRGRMSTIQMLTMNITGLVIAFTGYGTYHLNNPEAQWRVPISLQCVPALGLLIGCQFIPYSPRWLVMRGRNEEARNVLKRLHDDRGDHFWEKEYTQLVSQLEIERQETEGASFFHIFTNRKELFRASLAIVVLTACQTCGAQTILVFQSVIYSSLGFSTSLVLLMACVFQAIVNLGGFFNMVAIDRYGRRPLMLSGLVLLSIFLGLFALCLAKFESTNNPAWGKAGISMVMIFIFIYGCTWVSTGFAYAAEVQPTKIRAQGMALGMFSSFAWVIIYGQVTPIAYTAVKWKFLFLWVGFNLFFLPIIYFFCKETKGLTLEEMNAIFGEVVSRRLDEITIEEAEDKATGIATTETAEFVNVTNSKET
ncbi:hypothetical protein CLAIMM_09745 [Cladophialophora immunda]|nr:hypothetical protein CLAIMM_09745 [Cladophialophora immunda]